MQAGAWRADMCDFGVGVIFCEPCRSHIIPLLEYLEENAGRKYVDRWSAKIIWKPSGTSSRFTCWMCTIFQLWIKETVDFEERRRFDSSDSLELELELSPSPFNGIQEVMISDSLQQADARVFMHYIRPNHPRHYTFQSGAVPTYRYLPGSTTSKPQLSAVHDPMPATMKHMADVLRAEDDRGPDLPNATRLCKIEDWLRSCNIEHNCMQDSDAHAATTFLPRRLLDIEPVASLYDVKLIETATLIPVQKLEYATLSHCWGNEPFLTLRQGNLGAFLLSVPVEQLGRTFREAIYLCRALGIRFLWIDSLCIVQDSPGATDWQEQAPIMHQIYGNSYLNLAATASYGCHDGLWRPARPAVFHQVAVLLSDGSYLYTPWSRLQTESDITQALKNSKLFTRGWCLQELFLARRTLHMADYQMYWQCHEFYHGEVVHPKAVFGHQRAPIHRLPQIWDQLRQQYLKTQVTMPQDRVVAFSSLAAWYHEKLEAENLRTTYLLGCWEHTALSDLLWLRRHSPRTASHRGYHLQSPLVLPSWSWLSFPEVEFPISTATARADHHRIEHLAKISRIFISPAYSGAVYGSVTSAEIYITAPLCKWVQTQRPQSRDATSRETTQLLTRHIQISLLRGGRVLDLAVPAVPTQPASPPEEFVSVYPDQADTISVDRPEGVIFAPLIHQTHDKTFSIYCLILDNYTAGGAPSHTMDRPVYRRIGLMEVSENHARFGPALELRLLLRSVQVDEVAEFCLV